MTQINKETKKLVEQVDSIVSKYETYQITNNSELEESGSILKEIKAKSKEIETTRKGMTDPLNKAKATIMEFFNPYTTKLATAAEKIKKNIQKYMAEQERIRREEQAKLDAEKKEAEEKAKLYEGLGDFEKGREARKEIAEKEDAVIYSPKPKVDGRLIRKTWKARVIGQVPIEYTVPNMQLLNDIARSSKGSMVIANVEYYEE